jgi:hypothetical protein
VKQAGVCRNCREPSVRSRACRRWWRGLASNLGENHFISLEYYADFGKIGEFLPLPQQYHDLYAVTHFKAAWCSGVNALRLAEEIDFNGVQLGQEN